MSIKEFFRRLFSREEKVKLLASQKTQIVKKEIEKLDDKVTDEEAKIENAAKLAYEQYEKGLKQIPADQQEAFAKRFTELLLKQEEIPEEAVPKYIIEASKSSEVETIVPAIEELPDDKIKDVILKDDFNFSLQEKKEIAKKGIEDEKVKKKTLKKLTEAERQKIESDLKKQLKDIYSKSDKMPGEQVIEELIEIDSKTDSLEIKEIIKQVLARKAAMECKLLGNTRITEMMRNNTC